MSKFLTDKIISFPKAVIVVAILVLATAIMYGTSVFNRLTTDDFAADGSQSQQVYNLISKKFTHLQPRIVVLAQPNDPSLIVTDDAYKTAVQSIVSQLNKTDGVAEVLSYYNTGSADLISYDKTKTYLAVRFSETANDEQLAAKLTDSITSDTLKLSFGGDPLIRTAVDKQVADDLSKAETISFIILTILLVFVFRGFVAALLPIALGGFTILVSFLLLQGVGAVMPISQYAINIIIALGLGLSIDYSLLIVSRFREELITAKNDVKTALSRTMRTAGHTVFFSGLTVVICLLALAIFPVNMLRSMGLGGTASVLSAMFAGLVVLPAILKVLGTKVNSLSFGKFKRDTQNGIVHRPSQFWHRLTYITMKRPVLFTVATLAVLVAAGLPLMSVHLRSYDYTLLPESSSIRQTLATIDHEFPNDSTDYIVAYSSPALTSAASMGELYSYSRQLEQIDGVAKVGGITNIEDNTALIKVTADKELSDTARAALLDTLRSSGVPSGATVLVGGQIALDEDVNRAIGRYAPVAVAWMAIAIFVLMFLMLKSVVLPIKAMILNALSLCAALGIVVWIFQDGYTADWFGFNADAGVNITQPIIIFAIAFGLSMDYAVFLYSRIKEEYDRTGDTKQAVADGLYKTGGIITSAAFLLFIVVVAFTTSKIVVMQQIGVGLAVAILVDAFIVRIVLVPASMALLGKWNWWTPKVFKRHRE